MGGDAKNGAGIELIHAWVRKTDHGETYEKRVGREMVLSLPGGGHEGSSILRHKDVNKYQAENGRAIHCNATASGPLRGD